MPISASARQRVTSGIWGGRKAGSFAGREEVVAPFAETESYSGGYPTYETRSDRQARVRRERERLGIIAPEPAAQEVIERVAERQAGDASLDELQRTEELVRELEAAGLEMQRGYLQLLEVERTQARTEELRRYLLAIQRQRDDDDAIRALLMIALMQ